MEHKGTQRLETERLILRRFTIEDAPATFANWCCDPEVARYTTWPAHPGPDVTRQLLALWVDEYDRPDRYNWVLELKQDGTIIGNISVVSVNDEIDEMELGWCQGRAWWGKGYMPEAARAVRDFLFDRVGANRLCAKHHVDNRKSGRVMEKMGMRFEGIRRQGARYALGLVDVACYAVLKSDMEHASVELWDARDVDGNLLGVDLVRGEPVPEGMYHIVSEVIVRHKNGNFLLMRRDPNKPIHPGKYELTAGGSALKGEDELACVKRELYEETGLACADFIHLNVDVRTWSHCLFHVFYCETDCDPDAIRLQAGETVGWRWVSRGELLSMLDGDELVPSTRTRIQAYMDSDLFRA